MANMKAMVSAAVLIEGMKLGEAFRFGVVDLIVDFSVDGDGDGLTDDDCTMALPSPIRASDRTAVKTAFHPDELST